MDPADRALLEDVSKSLQRIAASMETIAESVRDNVPRGTMSNGSLIEALQRVASAFRRA